MGLRESSWDTLLWATFAAHQGVFANHLHAVSCLSPRVLPSAWGFNHSVCGPYASLYMHSLIPQFTLLCAVLWCACWDC